MMMSEPAPGEPSSLVTCTPATRPWMASLRLRTGRFLISSAFTEATAPVRSERFWVP
jgi:hypothetical protein